MGVHQVVLAKLLPTDPVRERPGSGAGVAVGEERQKNELLKWLSGFAACDQVSLPSDGNEERGGLGCIDRLHQPVESVP